MPNKTCSQRMPCKISARLHRCCSLATSELRSGHNHTVLADTTLQVSVQAYDVASQIVSAAIVCASGGTHIVVVIASLHRPYALPYPMRLGEVKGSASHRCNFASGDGVSIDWREVVALEAQGVVEDGATGMACQVEVAVLYDVDCNGRHMIDTCKKSDQNTTYDGIETHCLQYTQHVQRL